MDTVKKIFRFLSSILFYSIMLILVVVFIMFIAYYIDKQIGLKKGENRAPLFSAYVIISESMIPSINVYDAVLTVRATEEDIEIYDIITFISKEIETAGTPITHRVIDIVHDPEDESKIIGYRTKGDHNNTADFAIIAPDEVIGKVYLRIPFVGYLQTLMTNPIGWVLIVVIPCLLIIGSDVFKIFKLSDSKKGNKKQVVGKIVKNTSHSDIHLNSVPTPQQNGVKQEENQSIALNEMNTKRTVNQSDIQREIDMRKEIIQSDLRSDFKNDSDNDVF